LLGGRGQQHLRRRGQAELLGAVVLDLRPAAIAQLVRQLGLFDGLLDELVRVALLQGRGFSISLKMSSCKPGSCRRMELHKQRVTKIDPILGHG
jgi:hypothetical protein